MRVDAEDGVDTWEEGEDGLVRGSVDIMVRAGELRGRGGGQMKNDESADRGSSGGSEACCCDSESSVPVGHGSSDSCYV